MWASPAVLHETAFKVSSVLLLAGDRDALLLLLADEALSQLSLLSPSFIIKSQPVESFVHAKEERSKKWSLRVDQIRDLGTVASNKRTKYS